ncbi:MAG: hypothetical protein GX950_03760 [Candidatus Diapherotrites archaeon]|uniref:HTH arsR-type domain-containing protein n=1 Tax=Candidatus Iainarchaeum sp. TaxID=3101447 RepID=A0A7K4C077_9ARCH|nr:hypothetical protein [Candidatus Diapherotrites archaeon]
MKKLIIKISNNIHQDLKDVYLNPKIKANPNTHTLYLKDVNEFYTLFSPQRMELLRILINTPNTEFTINSLSKKLKRKQEAISRDTSLLEKYQLIKKTKVKQLVKVKPLYQTLSIDLSTKLSI